METIFSHIIRKRFSQVSEDVATDGLAYLLHTNEGARGGMMKILRGLIPDLPELQFKTQVTDDKIRPDMGGFAGIERRVIIENKFWAGLTDQQPVGYVKKLEHESNRCALLVIAPAKRTETLWREMNRLLAKDSIPTHVLPALGVIRHCARTEKGTVIGITSWTSVLGLLEAECIDDPRARGDIAQLRALCDAADEEGFTPISDTEITDQRLPLLMQQLRIIVEESVEKAQSKGLLSTSGLRQGMKWNRIGRWIRFVGAASPDQIAGAWFGVDFGFWGTHGTSPLWLVFDYDNFCRGEVVRPLLIPWAEENKFLMLDTRHYVALAMPLLTGEEKEAVVDAIVGRFGEIASVFSNLPPITSTAVAPPLEG